MNNERVARAYAPGIGQAVADRTINRRKPDGTVETWADVAERVAIGNMSLCPPGKFDLGEYERLEDHLRRATTLMSGRHLQHGDSNQPYRNMEVFTNCATAAASFLSFYLLLNGSGVGRDYSDSMMVVDWTLMPVVIPVIDWSHADVVAGHVSGYMRRKDAEHLYAHRLIETFEVPDSREGWAQAVERIETMAYGGASRDKVLLLDFSKVRPKGSPIGGMQDRPASGPGPLMAAISNVARLRDANMEDWLATMYVDHYLAECVLVGGARRAARMATKFWRDPGTYDFVTIKQGGFLWSANNSVLVDGDFWAHVRKGRDGYAHNLQAARMFEHIAHAAYHDGTGEPGIINVHKLHEDRTGLEVYEDGEIAGSEKYQLSEAGKEMLAVVANRATGDKYLQITNPCGEISLNKLAGFCVIADVVPFHADDDDDAEQAFRLTTRALIRTNLMDSIYTREVRRTNRIGVGMTGFHEWAYARFGYTWHDIIDETTSLDMWLTISRFKRAVVEEAESYSKVLGLPTPHTNTTFKPAGTTSKLFGLTEGAHLPPMKEYLRWVQFRSDDPLVAEYQRRGYPVRKLKTYDGTTIVGFPTTPAICLLGCNSDWIVTAPEASPEEQYQFLCLLEKYWIDGVAEDGMSPLKDTGNQVSYTLKFDPEKVSFEQYKKLFLDGQSTIRCCSVLPVADTSAYEYLPEEAVDKHTYERVAAAIQSSAGEDIGREHIDCSTGACPVDFNAEKISAMSGKVEPNGGRTWKDIFPEVRG